MIRIIVKCTYSCPEGAVTGTKYRTFDVEAEELEKFLQSVNGYEYRSVIGVSMMEKERLA